MPPGTGGIAKEGRAPHARRDLFEQLKREARRVSFHDPRELDILASRTWAWEPACHILWTLGTILSACSTVTSVLHYSDALKPPSEIDPAVVLLDKSVPQPMRDAVAALVNLGYAQP